MGDPDLESFKFFFKMGRFPMKQFFILNEVNVGLINFSDWLSEFVKEFLKIYLESLLKD